MYYLHAEKAIHIDGTKYYQVFRISDGDSRRGVIVTHWGAFHPGATIVPRQHGQIKVELMERGVMAAERAAIQRKKKRDYNRWDVTFHSELESEVALSSMIRPIFKDEVVKKIVDFMDEKTWHAEEEFPAPKEITGMLIDDPFLRGEPMQPLPPVRPEPEPIVQSAEWGTW